MLVSEARIYQKAIIVQAIIVQEISIQ